MKGVSAAAIASPSGGELGPATPQPSMTTDRLAYLLEEKKERENILNTTFWSTLAMVSRNKYAANLEDTQE
jgi:hypothetical protein